LKAREYLHIVGDLLAGVLNLHGEDCIVGETTKKWRCLEYGINKVGLLASNVSDCESDKTRKNRRDQSSKEQCDPVRLALGPRSDV
jgi:hypothetical protein